MRQQIRHGWARLSQRQRRWIRRLALFGLALACLWPVWRGGWLAPANPESLLHQRFGTTRLLDRHGRTLQAWSGEESTRHRRLRLSEVSPKLVAATLALEDQRFWKHPGVDPLAMLRAGAQNLRARRVISGASTLTQQLCKWLEPRPRTLNGKVAEALMALHLETRLTKQEILELYLSYAPYGGIQRGAVQASLAWLGKPAADLTWAEAAWLAVLPRSPARLNPALRPQAALADQQALLRAMAAKDLITPSDLARALVQPIQVVTDPRPLRAPHLAEHIAATLPAELAARAQSVQTTVDADLQRAVELRTRAHLQRLADRDVGNAAVVVIDNQTAEVLALVGSANYADGARGGANNGALALRQPGSTIKAFTYAAAFDRGWSPARMLLDLAAQFATPQGLWSPRNYGHREHGPVRARLALASSLNLPAVRLLDQLGVPVLREVLDQLGFRSLARDSAHYGLALTLGDGEVTLVELTAAFAFLARGGLHRPARLVLSVTDAQGHRWDAPALPAVQVVSAPAARQVFDILSDPAARELAFGRGSVLEMPIPVAAKTGTSKGFRDNWALGTSSRYTVGVWAGHFDGRPMQDVSGVTGAAPLLREVLLYLHQSVPADPLARPAGMEAKKICALSGDLAGEHCPQALQEWLTPQQVPRPCTWHRRVAIDRRNGLRAGPGCEAEHVDQQVLVDLPAELHAWAKGRLALAPQGDSPLCLSAPPAQVSVLMDVPAHAARYQLNPRMPAAEQAIGLKARSSWPQARLRWSVDGVALQEPQDGRPLLWPLQRGEHVFRCEALDPQGRVLGKARAVVVVD